MPATTMRPCVEPYYVETEDGIFLYYPKAEDLLNLGWTLDDIARDGLPSRVPVSSMPYESVIHPILDSHLSPLPLAELEPSPMIHEGCIESYAEPLEIVICYGPGADG